MEEGTIIVIILWVLILIHQFGLLSILTFLVSLLVFLVGLFLLLALMAFLISLCWEAILAYQVRKGNRVKINSGNIKIFQQMMFSRRPLIGSWLQRSSVLAFSYDNTPEAIRTLAEAVTNTKDRQLCSLVFHELHKLTKQSCIDEVCKIWATTRHPDLASFITQHGWIASNPVEVRVLSALKVRQLEVLIRDGAEVVEPLLQAYKDSDSIIAKKAKLAIEQLQNPKAQQALCSLIIMQDYEVAIAVNYAPHEPNQRALFYFLTAQWDKYESLDYEHTLLQTTYQVGDEQLRQRIAQKIRQAGRAEWVQIIAGGHKGKRLGEMTHEEWETALEILNSRRKCEEMWQLAQLAPPIWSARLLRHLKEAGWVPKTEFAELVQMGQMCVADLPELISSWRCQSTLHEHTNRVKCLSISPDGSLLASSSSRENIVRLWSLSDGKPLQTLSGHSKSINCIVISPDGNLLASGSNDKTIKLWSLPDGRQLQTLSGHSFGVNCIVISPDGNLLASGSADNTVRLWSLPNGKPLQTLSGHSFVNCIVISPDGNLLASGSADNTVRLWSLPDGKPLQTLSGHSFGVNCIVISPDGNLLASGSADNTVRLWSLPDGKPLQTLSGHSKSVKSLAISPDGDLLASGSADNTVRLRSLPDGKLLQTLSEHSDAVNCLAISPNDKLLVSGSNDYTVRLWTSVLSYLSRLPIKQMSAEDMQRVQRELQDQAISKAERDWLKFIQALVNWQRRFDVEVAEAPQRINAGVFDIEIEG